MSEKPGWEPIDLIMLRYLEIKMPGPQPNNGSPSDQSPPGYLANVINTFIASSPTLAFGGPGEGVVIGDSYRTGQAVTVGPNAIANNITLANAWNQLEPHISLPNLSQELEELRKAMKKLAGDDLDHDEAVGEIARAGKAAKASDGPSALEHLRAAGSWALDVAKSIGVEVAAAAIKAAIGLPA